jgi:hypothetical protein
MPSQSTPDVSGGVGRQAAPGLGEPTAAVHHRQGVEGHQGAGQFYRVEQRLDLGVE